jgi:hypothetical protein
MNVILQKIEKLESLDKKANSTPEWWRLFNALAEGGAGGALFEAWCGLGNPTDTDVSCENFHALIARKRGYYKLLRQHTEDARYPNLEQLLRRVYAPIHNTPCPECGLTHKRRK